MNIQQTNKDIEMLRKALNNVMKTKSYFIPNKATILQEIQAAIWNLEDKIVKQGIFIQSLADNK